MSQSGQGVSKEDSVWGEEPIGPGLRGIPRGGVGVRAGRDWSFVRDTMAGRLSWAQRGVRRGVCILEGSHWHWCLPY